MLGTENQVWLGSWKEGRGGVSNRIAVDSVCFGEG